MDGVSPSQPALALAAAVLDRVDRAGLAVPRPDDGSLGAALLGTVARARAEGLDAEAELRRTVLAYAERVRAAERAG
jgi:XTP/dITP diphosphohydrolase